MALHIAILIVGAWLAVFPSAATAQSSAVHVPAAPREGETFPVSKKLEILDTDYPLESLLANEEGRVTLNLIIGPDGRVVFGQVLASSGSTRLDQATVQLARSRWEFQPYMKDGAPAIGSARVDVTWKTPLRPAYEYQMDAGLLPSEGEVNFVPAVATTSHAVVAEDYPTYAIRTGQQGTVRLKFVILETGNIGDVSVVQTSGAPMLDEAAAKIVKSRWLYKPATLNGRPIPQTTHVRIIFLLGPSGIRPRIPARECFPEPLLGPSLTMSPEGGRESVEVGQWIHLTADGAVDDLIVSTQRGWMHFAPSAVAEYSRAAKFPPAARERRPPSCWFDGTVTVTANQK